MACQQSSVGAFSVWSSEAVAMQAIIGVDRAILRRRGPLWHSEPESEQLVFRTVEEIKAEHAKEIEAEVVRSLKEA